MRYFSSPDCEIYVNNILAKEAILVDFNESSSKLPIYSWRDRYFSNVANGNVLVTGSIIYNQSIPNYIKVMSDGVDPHQNLTNDDPLQSLRRNVEQTLNNLAVATDTNLEQVKKAARLNRILNYKGKNDTVSGGTNSADIDITIRTPIMDLLVKAVKFNSKASQVDATRSDNIKMAMGFIAREVTEVNPTGAVIQEATDL